MAAVVANKVKRNRSARHSNKQGGVQLEIDQYGKLRKVGGDEEEAKKKREAAKRPNAGYYRKVRAKLRSRAMFAPKFRSFDSILIHFSGSDLAEES